MSSLFEINTLYDLMRFFGTYERPVSPTEFNHFWKSLSVPEKSYYLNAKLR